MERKKQQIFFSLRSNHEIDYQFGFFILHYETSHKNDSSAQKSVLMNIFEQFL